MTKEDKNIYYELIMVIPPIKENELNNEMRSLKDFFESKNIKVIKEYDFDIRNFSYRIKDTINQVWLKQGWYYVMILEKNTTNNIESNLNIQLLLKWYYRTGNFKLLRFETTLIKSNKLETYLKKIEQLNYQSKLHHIK